MPPAPEPNLRIVGEDKTPADPVAAQAAAVTKDRPKELQIKLNEDVSMEFVLVPAGSFLMGSLKGGRFERPRSQGHDQQAVLHRQIRSDPGAMGRGHG